MSDFFGGKDLDRAIGCLLWLAVIGLITLGCGITLLIVWLCGGFQ